VVPVVSRGPQEWTRRKIAYAWAAAGGLADDPAPHEAPPAEHHDWPRWRVWRPSMLIDETCRAQSHARSAPGT